jgi:hypothetical protein
MKKSILWRSVFTLLVLALFSSCHSEEETVEIENQPYSCFSENLASRNRVRTEYPLLHVTTDADHSEANLSLILDKNADLVQLRYVNTDGADLRFNRDDLIKGVVLIRKSNRDIIKLQIDTDFDLVEGGAVNLSYLYNGLTGTYRDFPIRLTRSGHQWSVQTDQGKSFKSMFLHARKWMGELIGIDHISVSDAAQLEFYLN